ncbi:MAG TPA: LuxR C-terminal-related transcriptional regulator [Caulobacteraceae bacterium]|nr:LuxR C-terminal-related transcriptional regulator [Caulobacteraceae bacterium]
MQNLASLSSAAPAWPRTNPRLASDEVSPIVFVVDDDDSLRSSLARLVGVEGFRCEAFESAAAFLSQPAPMGPHCMIIDINLRDFGAPELQNAMIARCRRGPIIFVAEADAIPTTVRAMKPEALEFLAKPIDEDQLRCAVCNAIAYSAQRRRREMALDELHERYRTLSRREREVMGLVVAGLANKQVARRLDVAEITVKVHRGRAMEKMAAASFADLVRMSLQLRPEANEAVHGATTSPHLATVAGA